ncbi:MAG TPA: hypothetical protein VFY65_02775, partial [Longimicrobium sp.]|nr:hypothetical protein [Longimicrobium sp.]
RLQVQPATMKRPRLHGGAVLRRLVRLSRFRPSEELDIVQFSHHMNMHCVWEGSMPDDWRDALSPAVRRMLAEDTEDPDIQAYNYYRLQKYAPELLEEAERRVEDRGDDQEAADA